MKANYPIATLALAALCCATISCGAQQSAPTQASAAAPSVPEVECTKAISQQLVATIKLPGELLPYESVEIYAKQTGFVKTIRVDRGSHVKAGELIAQLEAPELISQRAQAEANYQSALAQLAGVQAKLASDRGTFERMSAAAKTPGVVAGNDLQVAQKTVEADDANVAAYQKSANAAQESVYGVEQLEAYLRITAPFDGQVTTRYVHPGALVGPAGGAGGATPIVRIETLTRQRLVVPVPENDTSGIPEGTQVSFTVPSFPGRTFKAPVAHISHGVDAKTRTMPVELDVNDAKAELVPGTYCEVDWPVRRASPTLFVPASAVASDLEHTFVIRVRENKTEWVDVKTGARVGNLTEVFGDLKEGDLIATRGTDQLRAGTQVSARLPAAK
jgi:membrane fusion protein, multidrug efflux system